jgi:hypothetical protein
MESNCALGILAIKCNRKEYLLGYTLVRKSGWVDESDFAIILRVTHQAAAPRAYGFETLKTCLD